MPRVLIAPYPLRHQPGAFRDQLIAAGFTPIDPDGDGTLNEEVLAKHLPSVDAMLAGGEAISAKLIALAPSLRVIARTGVGYDAVDTTAATARKIAVTITPGTNERSVAEHTFALLLALARSVPANDRLIRTGGWDRTLVRPIRGATLGILGLGRIGRAVATRARAFEMRVLAFDPLPAGDFESRHGIERGSIEDVLTQSDVLSLHLPLTAATRHLIRRETLARMKPGALLINTARGGLVHEADLVESLESGRLGGAGLDVLESEPPPPDHPLLKQPNVVFSSHLGGIDTRAMANMAEMAARCVVELHQGRWPAECIVNPEIGPGWKW